jgi:carboxypeptidase C (cathepsin A)
VEVNEGTELFYYFVESDTRAEEAPFLLWLTGGDRCSVFSGLANEIGLSNRLTNSLLLAASSPSAA